MPQKWEGGWYAKRLQVAARNKSLLALWAFSFHPVPTFMSLLRYPVALLYSNLSWSIYSPRCSWNSFLRSGDRVNVLPQHQNLFLGHRWTRRKLATALR